MPRYLFSAHAVEGQQRPRMSDEQMRELTERLNAFESEMHAAGAWVFSAQLHGPDTATVVRMQNGEVLTTDGPFAETKDNPGGWITTTAPSTGGRGRVRACGRARADRGGARVPPARRPRSSVTLTTPRRDRVSRRRST